MDKRVKAIAPAVIALYAIVIALTSGTLVYPTAAANRHDTSQLPVHTLTVTPAPVSPTPSQIPASATPAYEGSLTPEEGLEYVQPMLISPDESVEYSEEQTQTGLLAYRSADYQYVIDRISGYAISFEKRSQKTVSTKEWITETDAVGIADQQLCAVAPQLPTGYTSEVSKVNRPSGYEIDIRPVNEKGYFTGACATFHIAPNGEIMSYLIYYQDSALTCRSIVINRENAIMIAANAVQAQMDKIVYQWGTPGDFIFAFKQYAKDIFPKITIGMRSDRPCWTIQYDNVPTNWTSTYDFKVRIDAMTGEVLYVNVTV